MSAHQTAEPAPAPDRARLARLCRKYEVLCDLRSRALVGVETQAPRRELAALAREFPGALRELDRVPMLELERRLTVLRAVIAGEIEPEPWMALQVRYHGFMRAVLRLKRTLGSRNSERRAQPCQLAYTPAPDEPPLARFGPDALAMIRNPPGGRLNPWVLEQVASDSQVTPACIERALWCAE